MSIIVTYINPNASRKGMNKRGVFFLVDALVAVAILIVGLVLVLQYAEGPKKDIDSEVRILNSFLTTISSTQMQELDDNYAYHLINNSVVDPEVPVYIAIAQLYQIYKSGDTLEYAVNLTKRVTKVFHNESQYGFYYKINETYIYNQSFSTLNASEKRVTLQKMTFFTYTESGQVNLFGPVTTEVSLWIR